MYRLKVRVTKTKWRLGIVTYETILDAQTRQLELLLKGIESKLVSCLGENNV